MGVAEITPSDQPGDQPSFAGDDRRSVEGGSVLGEQSEGVLSIAYDGFQPACPGKSAYEVAHCAIDMPLIG